VVSVAEGSGYSYGPGHGDVELDRLQQQARLIDPITRRWIVEAGVGEGMRVLDVGSGVGDVALLAAELVSETGMVGGTDRASVAVNVATQRAASSDQVRFVEGDPSEINFDEPFDAVVGRYVLMYQADPAAMLRKLCAHLRPAGVVMLQECYRSGLRSFRRCPATTVVGSSPITPIRATGGDPDMGIKLHATFVAAGLPPPTMRMESVIAGGPDCSDHINLEVHIVRTLLPAMEHLGLAIPSEIDIDRILGPTPRRADRHRQRHHLTSKHRGVGTHQAVTRPATSVSAGNGRIRPNPASIETRTRLMESKRGSADVGGVSARQ
jgi:SAM-dependent methyltransferase